MFKALSRQLRDTLQLKFLRTWINIRPSSSLVKHHETKIDEEGDWKMISFTKIQVYTLNNIPPKQKMTFHLLFYASFCPEKS